MIGVPSSVLPSQSRHPELVSGSIERFTPMVFEMRERGGQRLQTQQSNSAKWTLKQVQGDGNLGLAL